ncbi:MAG TPA: ABC transporter substrate-binding protein [Xanthobacteraceae bacterium]|nr:ABC transporter substrate-binding protein [Xanthobacteraceae bacterium]
MHTLMTAALAGAAMFGTISGAAAQTKLKVMVFPGLANLAIFAAQHNNFFGKQGLAIELLNTPNSDVLRDGLAKGDHQIAHAAVDNAVAMVELAKADVIIVTGGDNGFNRIFVQPEINSYADLRGKAVVVDAPNTAYALLLYKVLKDHGLNKGDYTVRPVGGTTARLEAMTKDKANAAAGVLNPPYSFRAREAGLKDMGPAATAIGAYQAGGVFVMREWAKANSDTLVRYIAALIEGNRWALDPANKDQVIGLLAERLKLSPQIAAQSYAVATNPAEGMAKDARFDMEGFKNTLKLRAEIEGQWGGNAPPPAKYIDLSYYDRALSSIR